LIKQATYDFQNHPEFSDNIIVRNSRKSKTVTINAIAFFVYLPYNITG